MTTLPQLARRLAGSLAVPALLGAYVLSTAIEQGGTARWEALRPVLPFAVAALVLIPAVWLYLAAAPMLRLVREGPAEGRARRRAGARALLLPLHAALDLFAAVNAFGALLVLAQLRSGLPVDLGIAQIAGSFALSVMAAMFGYATTALATAPLLLRLGPVDLRSRGTLGAKILGACSGLLVISTLLVGATSYGRYRLDVDRAYLEAAHSAQEHAAAILDARGPAAAAEFVELVTRGATAVLGPDGGVLASSGDIEGERLVGGAAGVSEEEGGWVVRRPAGAYTIATFLPDEPLRLQRVAFRREAAKLGLALLLAAAILVALTARFLSRPVVLLERAARSMAAGDLSVSPPTLSRDEIGRLASEFRKMAEGLASLVREVKAASVGVEEGSTELAAIGAQVRSGAEEAHGRLLGIQASVEAMQGSVTMVGQGLGGLADDVHTTSATVSEMAAALEEVRRQAQELGQRVLASQKDSEELARAGKLAEDGLASLDVLARSAHQTVDGVTVSASALETAAVESQLASAQAAELAESAEAVVGEAAASFERLRSAVSDAKARVRGLGRRSDQVETILDFIGEVAGRTNLLSLNASIIASQAGEHGRSFGVVAHQIRELAAQISASTKSIGDIIGAVRDDVAGTARLIERTDELAAAGVDHERRSIAALQEIRTATARGHETAAAIRDAVQIHAQSTREVNDLVASVAESSQLLGEAVRMVAKNVEGAGGVSRAVGELASRVTRELGEQSGLGRRQLESLERIDAMLADIGRAVANHDAATRRMREALASLDQVAVQHDGAVVELSGIGERLAGRSRALAERVGKFKL